MTGKKRGLNHIVGAVRRRAERLFAPKIERPVWATGGKIAHAGGGIDGVKYSNSREALAQTIAAHKQVVEMDFMFTTDGVLVCEHGWKENHRIPQSFEQFRATPAQGVFTHLTAEEALRMLAEDGGIWLVVDTQEKDYARVFRRIVAIAREIGHEEYLNMIVPEVYHQGEKEAIERIYPFAHWLFSVYKLGMDSDSDYSAIARYCRKSGIGLFTMSVKRATAEHVGLVHRQGVAVAAHTVNSEKKLATVRGNGVDIVFTDFL